MESGVQRGKHDAGPHDTGGPDAERVEARQVSFFDTLRNIDLTDMSFELFHEAPSELSSDDEVCGPAEAPPVKEEEISRLLDEYDELDVDSLDISGQHMVRSLVKHVLEQQQKPKRTKLRDKIMFVVGTGTGGLTAFWLGRDPSSFYRLYTWMAVVLFIMRWIVYRYKRWHYYMFDFCYLGNVMLVVTLNYFPTNIKLLKMCFSYSLGPLAWSILAFRNSLVFHSVDKITSLFLHLFPPCACWAARWYPAPGLGLEADPQWAAADLMDIAVLPMLPYLLWATLYYCKIFITSSERISQRGYDTLFKYVTAKPSFYANAILNAPEKLQPLVYMGFHLVMTAISMVLCKIWWANQYACSLFVVSMYAVSAWNGANFYFEVFARRYLRDLGLGPAARASASPSKSKRE